MAIFNSYFDITRGYTISPIRTSPSGQDDWKVYHNKFHQSAGGAKNNIYIHLLYLDYHQLDSPNLVGGAF